MNFGVEPNDEGLHEVFVNFNQDSSYVQISIELYLNTISYNINQTSIQTKAFVLDSNWFKLN